MEYKAIYKCRLCGETYADGCTTGRKVAERCMAELVVGVISTQPLAPTMTTAHNCGGDHAGSLGLADFQGWKRTKEE
jgi:hypothetical protein